jgi:hypothetical protein
VNRRAALVALASIAALAACGGPTSGTVTEKGHGDAYVWYMQVCTYQGKYGCMAWTSIPVHEPERWYLTVRDDRDDYGRCRVEKSLWDRTSVGDQLRECGAA